MLGGLERDKTDTIIKHDWFMIAGSSLANGGSYFNEDLLSS